MKVPSPLYISSRLMAAFDVPDSRCADAQHDAHAKAPNGDCVTAKVGTIHVAQGSSSVITEYVIEDFDGRELAAGNDLKVRGSYVEAIGAMLSFLGACAEGFSYTERTGRGSENGDLFPRECAEWAVENEDSISTACMMFDELRSEERG